MGKNVSASAGILALLAVLLHMQAAPSTESPGSGVEKTDSATASDQRKSSTVREKDPGMKKSGDEPVEGSWLATQAYFHKASSLSRLYEDDPKVTGKCSAGDY